MTKKLTLVFCIAMLVGANAFGSDEHTQVLSLCELVNNWKAYHGREVKVRAIYTEQVVQERLYDPNCTQVGEVAVKWPLHLSKTMKKSITNLDRVVAEDSQKRAWLVIEGVFYGPEPYKESDIPSNLPPAMKEQMRKSHRRYGYMNSLDSMIEVTKLIDASEVAADIPARKTEPAPGDPKEDNH